MPQDCPACKSWTCPPPFSGNGCIPLISDDAFRSRVFGNRFYLHSKRITCIETICTIVLPVSSFEKTMKIWLIGLPFYLWICYNNNIEQRQFLPKKSTKCFAIAKKHSLCGKSIDAVDSAVNASLRTEKFLNLMLWGFDRVILCRISETRKYCIGVLHRCECSSCSA